MRNHLLLIFMFLAPTLLYSQSLDRQVIGSSGGTSSITGAEVNWTIGEAVTTTVSSGSHMLTQGFQQPFVSSGTEPEPIVNNGDILCYPNPVVDILYFEMSNAAITDLQIIIYNSVGQVVLKETIPNGTKFHSLPVNDLATGMYHVKIFSSASIVANTKIIKTL